MGNLGSVNLELRIGLIVLLEAKLIKPLVNSSKRSSFLAMHLQLLK